jgi:HEAT repeat protein
MTESLAKKLLTYHLARLEDKNPDVRLKAIHEIELLGDVDALDTLRRVYNTDIDLDVRRAAQNAGRAIFLRQQAAQS